MKYIDILNQSVEESAKADNQLRADEAKLNVESRILEIKKELATSKRNLDEAKRSTTFDIKNIYRLQSDIDLKERELKYDETILKEMF